MSTSSEFQERLTTRPASDGEERTWLATKPFAQERTPFSALPEGWAVIGRCRSGTGQPGPYATGCYALAHPEVGVALIDIVPNATPNAEARLRRALSAADFPPDFPGNLPVLHERTDLTALRNLPRLLDRGFAALPALTVGGGSAWVKGVRRAMAADAAWGLPGQQPAVTEVPADSDDDVGPAAAPVARAKSARPRRWGRLAVLPVGFAATFVLGLVSGFLLLEAPAPVAPTAVAALPQAPAAPVPATPAPAAFAPSESGPKVLATAAPVATPAVAAPSPAEAQPSTSLPAAEAAAPASEGVPPVAPQPVLPVTEMSPALVPVDRGAVREVAGSAGAGGGLAPSLLETRIAHAMPIEPALPMAPPRAPAAPVRVNASGQSGRPAPAIDRACSQALFRFQQGERLTAAEQNFVRTGCSTARR